MPDLDFEFYAGGIEDGILELLEAEMEGVKTFATYSGELDGDKIKEALGAISPKFPIILVSYTDGVDVKMPATAPVLGRSLHFRHDCTFAVICATNDARGETARRRGKLVGNQKVGVYRMIAQVRELLSGIRFKVSIEDVEYLLTTQVLEPQAVEHIARMPNITAFAAIFETAFHWSSPNRSVAGTPVTEFVLEVEKNETEILPADAPGIK